MVRGELRKRSSCCWRVCVCVLFLLVSSECGGGGQTSCASRKASKHWVNIKTCLFPKLNSSVHISFVIINLNNYRKKRKREFFLLATGVIILYRDTNSKSHSNAFWAHSIVNSLSAGALRDKRRERVWRISQRQTT